MIGIVVSIPKVTPCKTYVIAWCDLPPACEPSGKLQVFRVREHTEDELELAFPDRLMNEYRMKSRIKLFSFVVRRRHEDLCR